jgi:hypothetical protein
VNDQTSEQQTAEVNRSITTRHRQEAAAFALGGVFTALGVGLIWHDQTRSVSLQASAGGAQLLGQF